MPEALVARGIPGYSASKRALRRYPPMTVLLYTFAIAGAVVSIAAPPWTIVRAGYAPTTWIMLLDCSSFAVCVPSS